MDKLIVKCVICNTHHGDVTDVKAMWHMTPEETAKEAKRAHDTGAPVIHFHEPWKDGKAMGLAGWQEAAKLIRETAGDVIIEHGQGGMPYSVNAAGNIASRKERDPKNDLKVEHANGTEMMVTSLGMIDHNMLGPDGIFMDESIDSVVSSNTRRMLESNVRYYRECGVKPRMETFGNPGPFRNLEWLAARKAVDPPYCVTWNFGMHGIVGDPADIEYLKLRIAAIPERVKGDLNAECSVYSAGWPRLMIYSYAISLGYHIRLGMEDLPYIWEDVVAKNNAELIEPVVQLAKLYHREIATSDETRAMYKIPKAYPGKK